jgi:transcriptional regulator with XRE-family HTH domain
MSSVLLNFEKKIFAERLRQLRKDFGLSGPQLANKIGVDKSYIVHLERGTTKTPSVELLCDLAKIFNVSSDYLLGLDDKKPKSSWSVELSYDFESLDAHGQEAVKALIKGLKK